MSGRRLVAITAAAGGIGLAIAEALAERGYDVVLSDIDADKGEREARRLGARFRRCDVREPAEIEALLEGLDPLYGLVNNAGIAGPTAPVPEIAPAAWREVLDANLTAAFLACRIAAPRMTAAGEGAIVNMGSVAGRVGFAGRAPYCASKWGLLGLTATLARELGPSGVRVNAVLPGSVRGERMRGVIERFARSRGITVAEAEDYYLRRQATGRFVEPREVAETVAFLLGDSARSITGQFIGVDGGFE